MKTPQEFYIECVEKYHQVGYKHNLLKEPKQIFVPELLQKGNEVVLGFLKNESLKRQYQNQSPEDYYNRLSGLILQMSLVFATTWHSDFELFNKLDTYDPTILDPTANIITNDLRITIDDFRSLMRDVFNEWLTLHEPYWQLNDCRAYTLNDFLGIWQLGVSMVLNSYGM